MSEKLAGNVSINVRDADSESIRFIAPKDETPL